MLSVFTWRCQGFVQLQWGGAPEREGVCVSRGLLQTEIPRSAGKVHCNTQTYWKVRGDVVGCYGWHYDSGISTQLNKIQLLSMKNDTLRVCFVAQICLWELLLNSWLLNTLDSCRLIEITYFWQTVTGHSYCCGMPVQCHGQHEELPQSVIDCCLTSTFLNKAGKRKGKQIVTHLARLTNTDLNLYISYL